MYFYRTYHDSREKIVYAIKMWAGNTHGDLNQLVKFDTHLFIWSQVV